jgi:aspartyl-tRNA(Asn)/glutamyl-tRNA(Gln) amidotransferase subunit B
MIEAVIGLEIHAQLRTQTKMFCGCPVRFGAPPNTLTCPVCLGLPGALPVLNSRALDFAVQTALALGCSVNERSRFARKNYFYPDLPKGYQITQYDRPLASGGSLVVATPDGIRTVRILRLHLEEDAGKSIHGDETGRDPATLVDFNRSGVPLIEIVTSPDLRSGAEAAAFLRQLRAILVGLEVNDGNMENGSLRCDANVSIRQAGDDALGTRVEVKNVNSFRFLQKAIEHEVGRQAALLEQGASVAPETRQWDTTSGRTVAMRSKEGEDDYRYFPEPDLPALVVTASRISSLSAGIPELPSARRARLSADYGLAEHAAALLSESRPLADYFESAARESGDAKAAADWVRGEVLRRLGESGLDISASPVTPSALGRLIRMVAAGEVSAQAAKKAFAVMFASGESPESVVAREGLAQLSDLQALLPLVRDVLDANARAVAQYRAGKSATLGFLVGAVMKESGGRANPRTVEEAIRTILESPIGS